MMYSVLILYIFQNLFRCKFVVLSIFREDFKSLVWIEANTTYQKRWKDVMTQLIRLSVENFTHGNFNIFFKHSEIN